jgi:hypothetical protein
MKRKLLTWLVLLLVSTGAAAWVFSEPDPDENWPDPTVWN